MSNFVLFIFEGKATEQNITNNLCHFFINEGNKKLVRASFGFNVYKLFKELEKDPDLDTYELIIEQLQKRTDIRDTDQEVLDIEDSEKISDIYLFFDYDCHCTNANDEKVLQMLNRFDDPQGNGLLCISYPMVESIRHQENENHSYVTHSTSDLANYKPWINQQVKDSHLSSKYHNWGAYTLPIWKEIIHVNLARANQLTQNTLNIPDTPIEQLTIFDSQASNHIPNNEIAVLSSFPLMLYDFYGENLSNKLGL